MAKLLLVDAEAARVGADAISHLISHGMNDATGNAISRALTPQPEGDAVPFEKYRDDTLEAMAKLAEKATNNLAACRSEVEQLRAENEEFIEVKGILVRDKVADGYLVKACKERDEARAERDEHDRIAGEAVKLMREYGEENARLRDALLGRNAAVVEVVSKELRDTYDDHDERRNEFAAHILRAVAKALGLEVDK